MPKGYSWLLLFHDGCEFSFEDLANLNDFRLDVQVLFESKECQERKIFCKSDSFCLWQFFTLLSNYKYLIELGR